ncbi:hypothetical protein Tco_0165430, partial [Tanacetum coccineum]
RALSEGIALRTSDLAWQAKIRELEAADRRRQEQLLQVLTLLKSCQTQLTAALGRIQTLEARVTTYPEAPKEAGIIYFLMIRRKMAPKRATRANPAIETTTTTFLTNEQLRALINQGVADALAARDADRS